MSGLIHKVKDALTGDKDTADTTTTGTQGHHHSTTEHTAGAHGSNTTPANVSGTSTTAGPHSSNLANKADPRVDSDLGQSLKETLNYSLGAHQVLDSSRRGTGYAGTGTGTGTGTGPGTGTGTGTMGAGHGHATTGTTTAGPHSSNVANKGDPRVDRNLDSGRQHATGTTASDLGGTGTQSGYGHTTASSTAGPHSSTLANKVDPRVDSNLDSGNRTTGLTGTGTGQSVLAEARTAGSHRTGTSSYDHSAGTGVTGTTGNQSNDPRSSNVGPHASNLANKADPRIDSDLDSSRNTTGVTGTGAGVTGSGTIGSGSTSASHGSGIKGKFEDLVHGGPHHTETANRLDPHVSDSGVGSGGLKHASVIGQGSATAGPHSSNLANKADPRVDSNLDGSRDTSARGTFGGLSSSGTNAGYTGSHGTSGNAAGTTFGTTAGTTTGSAAGTTAGPHSSNLMNKTDPRVDSDRDGSRNMGAAHGTTGGLSSATGATGSHGATGTTAGPHSSNLVNKADPRVDSDRDGSRNVGDAQGTTTGSGLGTSGGFGTTGTPGHHGTTTSTGAAEGYGSTTGTGATGTTGGYGSTSSAGTAGNAGTSYNTSTGPATSTAGPHKSNLLNKLDPRVDSDLDRKTAKKRCFEDEAFDIDDFSDAPVFSSDDLQQDSLENYSHSATYRNKRQRSGPWWESSHQPQNLDSTVISPLRRNKKREFRRNIDSGVWMVEDDDEDDDYSVISNPKIGNLKTVTSDSGWLGGPLFPFWDEQPQDVQAFWQIQAEAVNRVNECVDNSSAVVDL
ncbi:MAG: hypothetical protein Q9167_003688, partial [Letrouitia subvulpina]